MQDIAQKLVADNDLINWKNVSGTGDLVSNEIGENSWKRCYCNNL